MTRAGVSIDIAESQEGDPSGKCTGSVWGTKRVTCYVSTRFVDVDWAHIDIDPNHHPHTTHTMTTAAFSGVLHPKKKAELREIASALHISDGGTREELQQRIRKHLNDNQVALEDNPAFAGLFRRKKGTRQSNQESVPFCARCLRLLTSPQTFRCIPCLGTGRGDIRKEVIQSALYSHFTSYHSPCEHTRARGSGGIDDAQTSSYLTA